MEKGTNHKEGDEWSGETHNDMVKGGHIKDSSSGTDPSTDHQM